MAKALNFRFAYIILFFLYMKKLAFGEDISKWRKIIPHMIICVVFFIKMSKNMINFILTFNYV